MSATPFLRETHRNSLAGATARAVMTAAVWAASGLAATSLAAPGIAGPAIAATYTSFDVPGAIATVPLAINAGGSVTGYCEMPADVQCGFVRAPDGTIETFGRKGKPFTWIWSINRRGSVTGYFGHHRFSRGLLRRSDGIVRRFNFAAARSTEGTGINDSGVIAGDYLDANFASHGFVRAANGTMTGFDPQDSLGTRPTAINHRGDVAGWYTGSGVQPGFVRKADGSITTFVVDQAQTTVRAINDADETAGYIGSEENQCTGFLRKPDGTVEMVSPAGASTIHAINASGATTGWYIKNNFLHGFVRSANGTMTTVDPPDSSGTQPFGISDGGAITGAYQDSTGATHGFIRTP